MTTPSESQALVLRPGDLPTHQRGGGARTTPLVSAARGASAFINGITRFEPGAAIPFHSHNCEESVLLLEGVAVLEFQDGRQIPLQPQDVTWIPPNLPHRIRNLSATQGMAIFWTYARLDANRTLTETGATRLVAAEHAG